MLRETLSGFKYFLPDLILSLSTYLRVPKFFKRYELWRDLMRHKLILLGLAALGVMLSLTFLGSIRNWLNQFNIDSIFDLPVQAAALAQGVVSENYRVFFDSSYKYLVLIVMELIIFQVAIRTIEIVKGKKEVLTIGLFARAQIRMIQVAVMNYVFENIGTFAVHAATGIVGLDFLDGPLVFFVQCFFLGHTIMDNYNEIQKLSIKESYHFSKHFPGVSFGIGVVLYVLLLIPIVGPLLGPIAACIAATLVMYKLDVDKTRASIEERPMEADLV